MTAAVLQAGDWRAEIRPDLGGAVTALEHGGRPVFRPTPAGTTDILATACFPLVPYANRIADGRFAFEGRAVRLPVLDAFAPHALHGDGWLRPWRVESLDVDRAVMSLDWPGVAEGEVGWPWPWRAVQSVALSPEGLTVTLELANTGDEAMPAGLGLHPYFVREPDASLDLRAEGVWLTDEREIPCALASPSALMDWAGGAPVTSAPFVDHAYAGWRAPALLSGGGRMIRIGASSNARWVQVYAPQGADFLCVEPVTHRPDALNAPDAATPGPVRLSPGESQTVSMSVSLA